VPRHIAGGSALETDGICFHRQPAAHLAAARLFGHLDHSNIGSVDQVPVPTNDLIGLALSRFMKCMHEPAGKGGEAMNGMTGKVHQD
jgi:hypothetical protein